MVVKLTKCTYVERENNNIFLKCVHMVKHYSFIRLAYEIYFERHSNIGRIFFMRMIMKLEKFNSNIHTTNLRNSILPY